MTISLNRPYAGMLAGVVVGLDASLEAALIAQGLAASSAAALTAGAQTVNLGSATNAIAIGASTLVITNNLIDAGSNVHAVVSQAAADGTLLRVERIVCTSATASVPAFFTIYGTASATAITNVSWCLINATPPTN